MSNKTALRAVLNARTLCQDAYSNAFCGNGERSLRYLHAALKVMFALEQVLASGGDIKATRTLDKTIADAMGIYEAMPPFVMNAKVRAEYERAGVPTDVIMSVDELMASLGAA